MWADFYPLGMREWTVMSAERAAMAMWIYQGTKDESSPGLGVGIIIEWTSSEMHRNASDKYPPFFPPRHVRRNLA